MLDCEACGERLPAGANVCLGCGTAVGSDSDPATPPARFGAEHTGTDTWRGQQPDFDPPAALLPDATADSDDAADPDDTADPDASAADPTEPSARDDPDFDPDETSHFLPSYGVRRSIKNNIALVALAITLVAAVSSLAWLIGQTVGGRSGGGPQASVTPTPTVLSTSPPRGSVVCTTEVARSDNTTCTVATRVLSAVRRLGTDLPKTFRVTIEHPQTKKNATFVCTIKSWIQCTGKGDVTVFVMRQA